MPRCAAPPARAARGSAGALAHARAACSAALSLAAWAVLVLVERGPVRALRRARRLGRRRRARGAVPRGSARRDRGAGGAARARVGADDRGDDAAHDVPDPRALSPHRRGPRPTPGALLGARDRRVRRACGSRFGLVAHALDARSCAGGALRLARSMHGWVDRRRRCSPAPALFQFSALKYRCLEECHTPFSFIMARWHGRSPRARRGASAWITASSASAAAGRSCSSCSSSAPATWAGCWRSRR